jgi:carbonic anhydrase
MASQSQAPPAPGGAAEARARNLAFAAAGGHEGVGVLPALRLFVVACIDPRVDPAHVLGLGLGDAIVLRNGGGRVTTEVIENLAFVCERIEQVVPEGPLFEVADDHHTHGAASALAEPDFLRRYASRIGAEEPAQRELAVVDPAETVARDVELLRTATSVSPRVSVSGHVYDVSSGLVTTVAPARPVGSA